MINFGTLLSRTWEIVRHRPILWLLALLAVFTDGSGFGFFPSNSSRPAPVNFSPSRPLANIHGVDQLSNNQQIATVLLVCVVVIVLLILFLYISYAAKAGMIQLVASQEKETQRQWQFKEAWRKGRPFAWRLWGLQFMVGVSLLATLLAYSFFFLPFILLGTLGKVDVLLVFATIVGILGLFVLVVGMSFYFMLIQRLGEREIVLGARGVFAALRAAHHLVLYKLSVSLAAWGVTILVSLLLGVILVLALVVLVPILFVVAAVAAFGANIWAMIVLGALSVGLALILVSGISAFMSTYWTLYYQAISYLVERAV